MHQLTRYIIFLAAALPFTHGFAQQPVIRFSNDPYFNIPLLKPGESPEQKFNRLIFLRAVASKSSVYTGEAVLVEYKLYRAVNSEPSPGRQPAFSGCSVLELSPVAGPLTEKIDGKEYHVILIRKVQLTPLSEGPLLLNEASINNVVQFINPNNTNLVQGSNFEAVSKPVTVDVKPLPAKDRPADFTGLVGNYTIATKADNNAVPAGENTHITVVVKGTGDIAGVAMPNISWPANTEHFEPAASQHLVRDSFPAGGEKTFDIPIIGSKEGTVVIPPVYLNFFNPETEKYDSVHTDSLVMHFTKARPMEKLHEIISEDITNRQYLWIVPAIALVVSFVMIITGKTQRKEKKRRQQEAEKPKEPLPLTLPPLQKTDFAAELAALAAIEDDHTFYTQAKELLTQALRQKLDSFAFYEADILQELQAKSHNKVLVETVHQIYKICNVNLYSPIINKEQRGTLLDALAEVIKQLEV